MSPTASPPLPDCTGVLVAGGQARRMGGLAKGLLRVGGAPIAARSLAIFRALFGEVLVVANDPAPYAGLGARVVPDIIPGKGAPGGLHAALSATATEWVFTAGCDMPSLAEAPILALAAWRDAAPALVVAWGDRLQPLHAFWSKACLPTVDRMLREGDPSFREIAEAVGARVVPEERWREIDPDGRCFANVNTLEEAERLGVELPGARAG